MSCWVRCWFWKLRGISMWKYLFTIPAAVLILSGILLLAVASRIKHGRGAATACMNAWVTGVDVAKRNYQRNRPGG